MSSPEKSNFLKYDLLKEEGLKIEKPAIKCRFYTENGMCIFNAARFTDTVPSLASNPRDINSPRYTTHMCMANTSEDAILNTQPSCDQYEKSSPDSFIKVIPLNNL